MAKLANSDKNKTKNTNPNKKWSMIGIIGLVIFVIILVVLFIFLKVLFWIGLVVLLALVGFWVYKYFQNKKAVVNEEKI